MGGQPEVGQGARCQENVNPKHPRELVFSLEKYLFWGGNSQHVNDQILKWLCAGFMVDAVDIDAQSPTQAPGLASYAT